MSTYALLRGRSAPAPPVTPPPPSAPAEAPPEPRARARAAFPPAPRYVLWMLVLFLILEYARPPLIVLLKFQMLFTLVLPVLFFRTPQRPWSRILTLQLLFFVWCIKSIPIAYNWYAVYFTARTLHGSMATALAFTWVCCNLRDLRYVLWIYLAVMVYQTLWSLAHGGKGTGGFLGDENDLALACCSALPLAFFGLERMKGRTRWLCGGALVLLLAGVVGSMSRGGFVALVCSGTYCLLASRYKFRAILLIAVAVVAIPILAPPTYIDEMRTIAETDSGTAKGRRFLWEAAYNMWKAHPILGVGGGNSTYLIGVYQPTDFEEREYVERDWSGTAVHSMYFQLLPEHGAVGVALVALMIWYQFRGNFRLLRDVRRSRNAPPDLKRDVPLYAHSLNGGLIAVMAAGAFLSVAYYPYLWYFTALSGALEIGVRAALPGGKGARPAVSPGGA